jgi:chromosome segregation ATPase
MSDFKVIETQEQLNEIIGERIKKAKEKAEAEAAEKYADYDELKAQVGTLTSQVEELTGQNTKLQESAAEAERNLAESAKYKTDLEKTRIALQAGLKIEYADRLRGETEEEWKADAEALAKDFASSHVTAPLGTNEPEITKEPSAREKFAEWANETFNNGGE